MPRPIQTARRKPGPQDFASVAISRTPDQDHLGLYYRSADGSQKQLHLAWHFRLRDEPVNETFTLWVRPNYPGRRLEQVAALARKVARAYDDGRFPYGFDQPFRAIRRTGDLAPDIVGLTCASFVIGVFQRAGLPLIQASEWFNDESDRRWQERIISSLEGRHPEQARKLIEQNGATRYRPIHTFAAACCPNPPVSKQAASERLRQFANELVCTGSAFCLLRAFHGLTTPVVSALGTQLLLGSL